MSHQLSCGIVVFVDFGHLSLYTNDTKFFKEKIHIHMWSKHSMHLHMCLYESKATEAPCLSRKEIVKRLDFCVGKLLDSPSYERLHKRGKHWRKSVVINTRPMSLTSLTIFFLLWHQGYPFLPSSKEETKACAQAWLCFKEKFVSSLTFRKHQYPWAEIRKEFSFFWREDLFISYEKDKCSRATNTTMSQPQ
jgi:hypothetical protein